MSRCASLRKHSVPSSWKNASPKCGRGPQSAENARLSVRAARFESAKTVFNLVAPDNDFEMKFAEFLHKAADVIRFAKLPKAFRFAIEYTDNATNLRYYEPDFAAVLDNDEHVLIETKGREDIDVAHKDRAAVIWCENATALTGVMWRYVKVPQKEFEELAPEDFCDLVALPALF